MIRGWEIVWRANYGDGPGWPMPLQWPGHVSYHWTRRAAEQKAARLHWIGCGDIEGGIAYEARRRTPKGDAETVEHAKYYAELERKYADDL